MVKLRVTKKELKILILSLGTLEDWQKHNIGKQLTTKYINKSFSELKEKLKRAGEKLT